MAEGWLDSWFTKIDIQPTKDTKKWDTETPGFTRITVGKEAKQAEQADLEKDEADAKGLLQELGVKVSNETAEETPDDLYKKYMAMGEAGFDELNVFIWSEQYNLLSEEQQAEISKKYSTMASKLFSATITVGWKQSGWTSKWTL